LANFMVVTLLYPSIPMLCVVWGQGLQAVWSRTVREPLAVAPVGSPERTGP
jgi:hypothetical protein